MKLIQRPYQTEALEAARLAYDRGTTRQLHEMATGLGKTAGFAAFLPEQFPDLFRRRGDEGGLLFVAHRREILRQTYRAFHRMYPDVWMGIEMGDLHATGDEDIIFVSVDSLGRLMSNRVLKYGHRKFGIVVFDEAHHLKVDGTWDNVATFFGVGSDPDQHFKLRNGDPVLSILMTATPKRHDRLSLAPFADEIISRYDYAYGVRNGWLVDIRAFYLTGERQSREIELILRAFRDYGKGHQTLVFAPSVAESAEFAQTVNERHLGKAFHVDGTTDKNDRKKAVDDFLTGRINLLSNYGVFTEGTDLPNITLLIDANETESESLFRQKVGRLGRTHPSANVDSFDLASDRLEAIAASPKPFGIYVATFDPTKHPLSVYSVLTGDDRPIIAPGKAIIGEILDTIEYLEETKPEIPVADIRHLDDIEITLREANVWTRTIYNEKLQALSPLSWVVIDNTLALHVPVNPFSSKPADNVPVVVSFDPIRNENGQVDWWKKTVTLAGGWNPTLKRAVRKRELSSEMIPARLLQAQVASVDEYIHKKRPTHYSRLVRRSHSEPEPEQLRYLKNAGIKYRPDKLTAGTADLLIAEHRVRKALNR